MTENISAIPFNLEYLVKGRVCFPEAANALFHEKGNFGARIFNSPNAERCPDNITNMPQVNKENIPYAFRTLICGYGENLHDGLYRVLWFFALRISA